MGIRGHVIVLTWAAMAFLIVIIGCGGSNGSGRNGGSVESVARFAGSWNGTMVGSDGSNADVYIVISNTGAISWTVLTFDPNNPDPTSPPPVTETGTIQNGGSFTVTGSTSATAGVTISGVLNQSGEPGGSTSTGCCGSDFLSGNGTMTIGSAQVKVTLQLSGTGV